MAKKIQIVNLENKNYLMVNDEMFDWAIEEDQVKQIADHIKCDVDMKDNMIASVFRNFTNCFSEFIGRQVTLKEINESILKGEI